MRLEPLQAVTRISRTVATLIGEMPMQCAKDLLLTTDLRIATVGFRSGYRHSASFARAFVRHQGISPLAVRAAPNC
jgi:AraC-like DNA-binding protein